MNIHILVHETSSKFKTKTVPFHAIPLCLGQGNHVDPDAQTYMQWHLQLKTCGFARCLWTCVKACGTLAGGICFQCPFDIFLCA